MLNSLVWAFGSLLNEKARREFNTWLLTNIKTKDQNRLEARLQRERDLLNPPPKPEESEKTLEKSGSEDDDETSFTEESGTQIMYNATEDFVIG